MCKLFISLCRVDRRHSLHYCRDYRASALYLYAYVTKVSHFFKHRTISVAKDHGGQGRLKTLIAHRSVRTSIPHLKRE
jgi:hypothetical protein